MMLKQQHGKLLSHYTSLKIGGAASFWLEPESHDEIVEAISVAEDNGKVLAVIGKGSNILAHDKGFDGVLMNLGRNFDYIEKEGEGIVRVGASVPISRLVEECTEWGMAGCEFLVGIPGSFGGAVFMNAGVRDVDDREKLREMRDVILDVDVVDLKDKTRKTMDMSSIDFSYRSSGLEGQCILGSRIKLEKDKKSAVINRIDSYMKERTWIQRLGYPSAGSVFKNPQNKGPAAILIERCGLKGKRIGNAEISNAHANFIVNTGGATSKDVLDLIELTRRNVSDKFGIDLELELRII